MVDRQDIDALLIGSLYGELSSTEEARLSAHLESHPADRSALANLSRARDVVRESRILQVQFDPPQSISALLMQEAARRAPKARDELGWFQRFMRSFIAHPAMAAAAMLVLIIGVAGTVYVRQGDHFANQTKDDSALTEADRAGSMPTGSSSTAQQQAEQSKLQAPGDVVATGSSDDFQVQLEDQAKQPADGPADKAASPSGADRGKAEAFGAAKKNKADEGLALEMNEGRRNRLAKESSDSRDPSPSANSTTRKPAAKAAPRLDVSTPNQGPKDFDSRGTVSRSEAEAADGKVAVGGTSGGAGTAPSAPRAPNPGAAPPPPAPAAPGPATVAAEEKPRPDPLVAWAKEQHGKVIAAVKAGNCQNAANIAVQISNRAPAYYASNVESDRTLKNCMSYITAQREKEAERVQRSKATQRRAVDEAPAPATTTK